MAASWLIGLVFLAVNVLMVVVLVISNSDFCASVFETQTGKLKPVTLWNRFENFVVSVRNSPCRKDILELFAVYVHPCNQMQKETLVYSCMV